MYMPVVQLVHIFCTINVNVCYIINVRISAVQLKINMQQLVAN